MLNLACFLLLTGHVESLVMAKYDFKLHESGRLDLLSKAVVRYNKAASPWGDKIELPDSCSKVMINVGTNKSPIDEAEDSCRILIDPLPSITDDLQKRFDGDDKVKVYQTAISDFSGTAPFHVYQDGGDASSLSPPKAVHNGWFTGNNDKGTIEVPVNTMKDLIDAIPKDKEISILKTDMQGNDLKGIKSAGDSLDRVQQVMSETYATGYTPYRGGQENQIQNWKGIMQAFGFGKADCTKHSGNSQERDCTWSKN